MSDGVDQTTFFWLLGGMFAVVSGALGFTHVRITQVEHDSNEAIRISAGELKEATQVGFSTLRLETRERSEEGRSDRREIWQAIDRLASENRELLDRIGQLPTREEMKRDLQAMEARLTVSMGGHARGD